MNLSEIETRILGALVEKQITTPEYYPLTLNALTAACNQKNNRHPVTSYTENDVSVAVETLREKNLVYVFYGSTSRVPKFKHVMPDGRVVWRVIGGPDEWVGNLITYDLTEEAGETVVMFTHSWREPVDFMFHCTTKWGYFLLSLKALLETGAGTPFPHDLHISSWS